MFGKIFVSIIAPLFILVPILLGILRYKNLSRGLKIMLLYLIFTALINTSAIIIGRVYHSNNLPLVHLYTLIEGTFFIIFYQKLLKDIKPTFFKVVLILFVAFCICNALFLQSIFSYSSYTRYVVSIIVLLCSLNHFAKLAATEELVYKNHFFYISVGAFLYFSGSFMLFIFSNVMLQNVSPSSLLIFWVIHSIFVLIMHLFFSISFLYAKND